MSLRTFQEEIKELVFFREKEPIGSRLWKEGVPDRLGVYRNNTRTNWTDTLDHDFPLTKKQFGKEEWEGLRKHYFISNPPQHWELNTSMTPFTAFLSTQKIKPYVKELADYEWHDLKIFIDRSVVRRGAGVANPTAIARVYQPGDMIEINGEYEGGSTINYYTGHQVRILNGRSANLWYGSYFPDAPQIFDDSASFQRLWAGPQRVFLWTELESRDKALAGIDGKTVFTLARSGGKLILTNRRAP